MAEASDEPTRADEPDADQQQQPADFPELDFSPAPNAGALAAASGGETNFAPNMIGDFFGGGGTTFNEFSNNGVVGTPPRLVLADSAIGIQSPNGPFNVISTVTESGGSYFYTPPVGPQGPNAAGDIIGQSDLNGDGIVDFYVEDNGSAIFPGSPPTLTYVAVSNGDITPSGHQVYVFYSLNQIVIPNPNAGDIVGRGRIQDNNSARPQDRVYFDYNYFHNATLVAQGVDVNRYSPGFEKTFFNKMASVEVRVPMASTVSSNVVTDGSIDLSNYELGNVLIVPKVLLADNGSSALAFGMGIAVPTADDINIGLQDGTQLLGVTNESVHLIPYFAYLYSPACSNWFAHAFISVDTDLNGNAVTVNVPGTGFVSAGTYTDQTYLSVDGSLGRWVYRDNSCNARVNGVALTAELHYTATVSDADVVSANLYSVGNSEADLSLLNGTFGAHARCGMTTFTAAYTVPFTSEDRVFDGEFRFFVNRNF